MPLFGSRNPSTVGELIARKRYPEAIEMLREQLGREANSGPLRMQLADVLVLAGRGEEAAPVLIRLADELARDGHVARAMALLKKVQRLEPGRPDVEARLAGFVTPAAPSAEMSYEPNPVASHPEVFEPVGTTLLGGDEDDRPAPADGRVPGEVLSDDEERAAAAYLRRELLDTITGVLNEPPPRRPARRRVRTPLFGSLSEAELKAFFRGLRLLSFEPGDLVIHQGDEGDRMFVITSGRAKVFVKEPGGRRRILVHTLREGDFFGELSLLRNEPRGETIVAASELELLELERSALESLCQAHPRVRGVLEDFSQERLVAQQDALARRERHGTAAPAAE